MSVAESLRPAPSSMLPRVIVKRRRARPLFARHPWLFAGSIERVEGDAADGAEVVVESHDGEFIARGLYNGQSQIRVRLYSWQPDQALDAACWRARLADAVRLRRDVLGLDDPAGACRLVFSEADAISGLVVDRYGPWLVAQVTSLAIAERLGVFTHLLVELCRPRGIYLRTERGVAAAEGLRISDGPIGGDVPVEPVRITEDDLVYEVDIRTGQKTGFYLDQRENRRAMARYARGRRVLDVFCYTGGFALAAARAGASEVLGVDVSEAAVAAARSNAALNGLGAVRFEAADAFEFMHERAAEGEAGGYGMVILDPPKFARHTRSLDAALRGYHRANRLAVDLIEPDGILVTCSCSGHVSRADFAAILGGVAEESGRSIQILAERGQAADHPVSASCLETSYLKCFIARVV